MGIYQQQRTIQKGKFRNLKDRRICVVVCSLGFECLDFGIMCWVLLLAGGWGLLFLFFKDQPLVLYSHVLVLFCSCSFGFSVLLVHELSLNKICQLIQKKKKKYLSQEFERSGLLSLFLNPPLCLYFYSSVTSPCLPSSQLILSLPSILCLLLT